MLRNDFSPSRLQRMKISEKENKHESPPLQLSDALRPLHNRTVSTAASDRIKPKRRAKNRQRTTRATENTPSVLERLIAMLPREQQNLLHQANQQIRAFEQWPWALLQAYNDLSGIIETLPYSSREETHKLHGLYLHTTELKNNLEAFIQAIRVGRPAFKEQLTQLLADNDNRLFAEKVIQEHEALGLRYREKLAQALDRLITTRAEAVKALEELSSALETINLNANFKGHNQPFRNLSAYCGILSSQLYQAEEMAELDIEIAKEMDPRLSRMRDLS